VLDVVGRATTVQTVAIGALVDLGQSALEEAAGHADQCGYPHPEHRTWTTEGHGDADTGDVARTDAAGKAEHQGLERAELPGAALEAVAEHREHVEEVTQLNETRANREVATEPDNEHDQYFP